MFFEITVLNRRYFTSSYDSIPFQLFNDPLDILFPIAQYYTLILET